MNHNIVPQSIPAATATHQKIIMGDFNINIQGTQSKPIDTTTKQNTTIDHLYTNASNVHAADVIKTYYSDHDQIFISTNSKQTNSYQNQNTQNEKTHP